MAFETPAGSQSLRNRIGLIGGPAALVAMLAVPPPADLDDAAWRTAAVAVLMATWWITEAIPLPATGLIPSHEMPGIHRPARPGGAGRRRRRRARTQVWGWRRWAA